MSTAYHVPVHLCWGGVEARIEIILLVYAKDRVEAINRAHDTLGPLLKHQVNEIEVFEVRNEERFDIKRVRI